jgi:chromosome segregation ATPase
MLILSLDALGDLTLRQPFLSGLLDSGASVCVVTRPLCSELLPVIDQRLKHIETAINPYNPSPVDTLAKQLQKLLSAVREWNPTTIICPLFNSTFTDEWLLRSLPGIGRWGFSSGAFLQSELETHFPLLARTVPVKHGEMFTDRVFVDRSLHECDKLQELFNKVVGVSSILPDPVLKLPIAVDRNVDTILKSMALESSGFAIVSAAPSSSAAQKAITDDQAIALIERLYYKHGLKCVLIGTAPERVDLERVAGAANKIGAMTAVWVGEPGSLIKLLRLISESRIYVGCDTGPMHFAAALGIPVLSIFGGGHFPRFLPRARQAQILTQFLPCFGCDWVCPFERSLCIEMVDKRSIQSSLDSLLTNPLGVILHRGHPSATHPANFLKQFALPALRKLGQLKATRNLFEAQLADLQGNFNAVEADRLARGQAIETQGQLIIELQGEVDTRLKELNAVYERSNALQNERNLFEAQLADLQGNFNAVEADRLARGQAIETQGQLIIELQGEVDTRLKELNAVYERSNALQNERNLFEAQLADLQGNFNAVEADRLARGQAIETQGQLITELQGEVDTRLKELNAVYERSNALQNERNLFEAQLADLQGNFNAVEADRLARGQAIETQGQLITELQGEVDTRLKELNAVYERSNALENERNLFEAQLADLQGNFNAVEADRLARGQAIETQGQLITELQGEVDTRLKELNAVYERSNALENERNLFEAQLADLQGNFNAVEADRLARGQAIETQGQLIIELQGEVDTRLKELNAVYEHSNALENERNLFEAQLADLQGNFNAVEADRLARGQAIETQGQLITELQGEVDTRLKELNAVYERSNALQNERNLFEAQLADLQGNFNAVEADRLARGQAIETQGQLITELQGEVDTRLKELNAVYERSNALENERNLFEAQLADLQGNFNAVEADRLARGQAIETQGQLITELQGEVDTRLKELNAVYERSNALENERNLFEAQLADLQGNFNAVEADRLARGQAIETQGQLIIELQGEVDTRLKELNAVYEHSNALENERNLFEAQLADLQGNFNAVEADRLARGQAIETQGQLITELQGEVDTRLKELNAVYERSNALQNERNLFEAQLADLQGNFNAVEADRLARGQAIETQGQLITELQGEVDTRLKELNAVYERSNALENERNLFEAQLADLQGNFNAVEADRLARGQAIETQGQLITELQGEVDTRLKELNAVYERSNALENERNLFEAQLADLQGNFNAVEADRLARGQAIETQGQLIIELQGEVDTRLKELNAVYEHSNALENERNLFEAQLADLQGNFNAVEADRLARGQAIETQGQLITELQGEVDTRLKELNAVYERSNALENERNLFEAQLADLQGNFNAVEADRLARGQAIETQGQLITELQGEVDTRLKELNAVYERSNALGKRAQPV